MKEAILGTGDRLSLARLNWRAVIAGLFLIAAGVTIAISVGYSRQQREAAAELERHSFEVLLQSQKLASALDKAEIGSRGYLFTNDRQFLDIFNQGANDVPRELARLKQLTSDNEAQQGNLDELSLVLTQRMFRLRQAIQMSVDGDQTSAVELVRPGEGFSSMAGAQEMLDRINRVENDLLAERTKSETDARQKSDLLIAALLLLMLAMVIYGIRTLVTAARSQMRADSLEAEREMAQKLIDADSAAVRAAAIVTAVGAATPDLIFAKDRDGRVTYANPSTLAVIGMTQDELLGKLTSEYNDVREQADLIDANDARIMESGVTEIIDETFTGADGQTRLFRSTKTPLLDAEGRVIGLAGVSIDVTADRAAMAQLKASEERFRGLSETVPAFIFITDDNGEITYTNSAFQEYTGKNNDELLGMGWVRTVHRDDRSIPEKAWSKAVGNQQPYAAEYRFRNHNGSFRTFMCRATPLRDPNGAIRQWIGTCSDIQDAIDARDALEQLNEGLEAKVAARTAELQAAIETLRVEVAEREKAEAQVRQMQKIESIGQLTGGIAHDFNNMLAVVLGSLEIVKRRMKTDPDKALAGIEHAEEGAKRAAQLTARLLAFSRQQPLAPEPVNANKLVSGMSELLRQTIGEQIEVETVLAGGLWRTHIDAPQLENAILNLCVNARDAMQADEIGGGGKLTIETHNCHLDDAYSASNADVAEGQYVLVSVSDSGTGMAPEVIERAFDPFYTTKEVGKGTGLGLSQVFGFVKQSGGHIKIYSELGDGTTVKLYLPRYFGKDEVAEIAKANPSEWPTAKPGETVLVVEDDAHVRKVSVQLIHDLGYEVIEAAGGAQALERMASDQRIDLVFTDIVMPGMTGRAMADEAAKLREGVKILYTTGYTRNAVVHNGVLDPGTEFLAKPYTASALAVKLRTVLDKA
jgi:PAS domain S-box-containing protein